MMGRSLVTVSPRLSSFETRHLNTTARREQMEVLIAAYGDGDSSSDDSDSESRPSSSAPLAPRTTTSTLPPPPVSLLTPPNSILLGNDEDYLPMNRVRSFPHVEGNYAVHVYIPVYIPTTAKKEVAQFLKKLATVVPGLCAIDIDVPLNGLCNDIRKLEQVVLGRDFHISLGRPVPIRVHQIDSMVTMLRQKLQLQRRYLIDFSKWEIFLNDEQTRTFISMEVISGGLAEISKHIQVVNEVYRLHNLPEFYKDPRPHISLVWALGDTSISFKRVIEDEKRRSANAGGSIKKHMFTCPFSGIECKIGNKTYKICRGFEE